MTETLDTPIVGVFWDELIALRKILHAAERHPYFEYETTKGARKCLNEDEPPEGENWTRNEDKGDKGFARFDFHDEAYWRRRRQPEMVKVDTDSGVIALSLAEFRPPKRDSLCPSGAALVSTMPAPSGFCEGVGCEMV